MSNYLAIATVTATLQRTLQTSVQLDVPGARVTTVRPDGGGGAPEVGINIYMYQAAPNPAWRNADLRNRRPKGDLIKQAQAGLDLYYLLTFYGNEVELEPQRLLGSAVRILVDQPVLTAEMIRDTTEHSNFAFLQESTLIDHVERVTIVPSFLSTDELSKIWSVFFQTPYILSFACQGGAVLIEGDRPSGRGLPIRSRQFYATPNQPVVERVFSDEGQEITAESCIRVQGKRLNPEVTIEQLQTEHTRTQQRPDLPPNSVQRRGQPKVQIGAATVTAQDVTESEIRLRLTELTPEEKQQLRAGVQSLQIVYPLVRQLSDLELNGTTPHLERTIRTNIIPIVFCPTIIGSPGIEIRDRDRNQISVAEISVTLDLMIDIGQRVFLLLNQLTIDKTASYIFAASKRRRATRTVTFTIRDVKVGEYLVRLQVDGAESLPVVEEEQFVSPRVTIQ
ncbi:MAG: DUF4255 domain-containing protein [Phormidesmis sp. CAN_BIN36]|nr:DUF4255 domain-containing protein [Phormidesmis sp. CAN_BIN36]